MAVAGHHLPLASPEGLPNARARAGAGADRHRRAAPPGGGDPARPPARRAAGHPRLPLGGAHGPRGRIGGDFYDFFQPTAGTVLAILGDVSGKGIPAALILSSLKTLFRTIARETVDPAAIAERISAALHEEHAGLPYATAIVARFETAPGRLAYVNAGHPAGYLLRDGTVTAALESGGRPLGLLPGATLCDGRPRAEPRRHRRAGHGRHHRGARSRADDAEPGPGQRRCGARPRDARRPRSATTCCGPRRRARVRRGFPTGRTTARCSSSPSSARRGAETARRDAATAAPPRVGPWRDRSCTRAPAVLGLPLRGRARGPAQGAARRHLARADGRRPRHPSPRGSWSRCC